MRTLTTVLTLTLAFCMTALAADNPDAITKDMKAAAIRAFGAIQRHAIDTPAEDFPAQNTHAATYRDKEKALEDAKIAASTDGDKRLETLLEAYDTGAGLRTHTHNCVVQIDKLIKAETVTQGDMDSPCLGKKKK